MLLKMTSENNYCTAMTFRGKNNKKAVAALSLNGILRH
jgi:hypothetical protein